LQLSQAGIKTPIVILTGFFDGEELKTINNFGFECVIHNFAQIEILEKSKLSRLLPVWLKIDTGMHRLGFSQIRLQTLIKGLYHILWCKTFASYDSFLRC